jgi:phospholipase C
MQARLFERLLGGLIISIAFLPGALLWAQKAPMGHRQAVEKFYIVPQSEPELTTAETIRLLQEKIKYVFVLYQENRSFDSYFGTFPNAEGIYSHPAAQTPGFYQNIVNTDGSIGIIQPFRMGPYDSCLMSNVNGVASTACYAADTDDMDHGHSALLGKMDIVNGVPMMDNFANYEELDDYTPPPALPPLYAKQAGELTMAYVDCDTIPLLWGYANKFVLFDHIFQLMITPSTPGNLSIIGAQSGVTQWALHPDESAFVPLLGDPNPFWGSSLDPTPQAQKMPYNPYDLPDYNPSINLTYATLPLTLMGGNLGKVVKSDRDPTGDLDDVQQDVEFISRLHQLSVPFGWYQEGFDKEPTDGSGPATHNSYVTHHSAAQYFGYISNNPKMNSQLHGLEDFLVAVQTKTLPREGGVFYVKGGYQNIYNLVPVDPDAAVQYYFPGDDEHPGYSDAQISEALLAEVINKIAASPYWGQSAIIITFDDSEGDYDHVPPPLRVTGPDGSWISDGPRVPLVFISPYARTNYVSQMPGNHASVVKFIDELFNLPPLALLPDELAARKLGEEEFGQWELGPQDAITRDVTDLLDAFSLSRLTGKAPPLPPSYVTIPESLILNLPQSTGYGCKDLGIITTDRQQGITNHIPSDFNPRPFTDPNP